MYLNHTSIQTGIASTGRGRLACGPRRGVRDGEPAGGGVSRRDLLVLVRTSALAANSLPVLAQGADLSALRGEIASSGSSTVGLLA
jgi:hypothetical protein